MIQLNKQLPSYVNATIGSAFAEIYTEIEDFILFLRDFDLLYGEWL